MIEKKITGRPSKIEAFINAFEIIVSEDINAVILTDEELIIITNDTLPEEDRIHQSTFEKWKKSALNDVQDQPNTQLNYSKFLRVYKKALVHQKQYLFQNLQNDPEKWQRYAWIIERKFDKWNLRAKTENENVNINRNTLSNEEIDNRINALNDKG